MRSRPTLPLDFRPTLPHGASFMKRFQPVSFVVLAACAAMVGGCSKSPALPAFGTMNVRMTDSPADVQSVNLVVREVAIHSGDIDSDSTSGWTVLSDGPQTYDLLSLRNGVFASVGLAKVLAGHYTQLRLKLGTGSTVVVDGVAHPLTVPSGIQSGLKLVGSFEVPANGLLDLALDFDAGRSIVLDGAGSYSLKPTVRVMPFSTAAAIRGTVAPAGTAADVFATAGTDTLGSATAESDGTFQVSVLPAGTYALAIHPAAGFRDTTLLAVSVGAGGTADLGTIALTPQ
ncbi:MAG: DUF4382 domain-containing protein [Candidatus Eisenbacteria bacterium]|uniref:DUF4382 domain-containing protein n=1 Tax=Eiseniibacteriota bacterium TaxID=2212470 RepID=A0A538SRM1_UNCEI|nr:MAG: DUF4382 domain-containing protein [Candidatus Eisenbacteria bacterium]